MSRDANALVSITLTARLWRALGTGQMVGEMEHGLNRAAAPQVELQQVVAAVGQDADGRREVTATISYAAAGQIVGLWADADFEGFLPTPFTEREVALAEACLAAVPPAFRSDRSKGGLPLSWRPPRQPPKPPTPKRRL